MNKSIEIKDQYKLSLDKIKNLQLCIVGQDPYPTGANGIAFCKNNFDDFFDELCCGKDVIFSLGLDESWIREKFSNPIELFFHLLSKGIAFINVSSISINKTTDSYLINDKQYNKLFLGKANNIVLLGQSCTKELFDQYYKEFKSTETVCHPSNKVKESYPIKWNKIWGNTYLTKFIDNEAIQIIE